MFKYNLKNTFLVLLVVLMTLPLNSVRAQDGDFDEFESSDNSSEGLGIDFSGSITLEQGANISGVGPRQEGSSPEDWTLANRRFRVKTSKTVDATSFYSKIDLNFNELTGKQEIDIREMRIKYTPTSWMDISVGRQVSTWGVGDMLYINDLFPKNWVSNFQGRENEMLKDSSNSLRVTNYLTDKILWDIVYHLQFAADTTPTGEYFTIYDPNSNSLVNATGVNSSTSMSYNNEDGELASQFKWTLYDQEMAFYFYRGFYKNPKSLQINSANQFMPLYSRLMVYGYSSEGQIGPGILSFETGYNNSLDDKDGDNALIENSSMKYLLGYKIDLTSSFSFGTQAFIEHMLDYSNYTKNLTGDSYTYKKKEYQTTYTVRLTYKAMQETLWLNLFAYIRPDHHDSYIKIDIDKNLTNQLKLSLGANIFSGNEHYNSNEFSMLRSDDNIYARLRFDF